MRGSWLRGIEKNQCVRLACEEPRVGIAGVDHVDCQATSSEHAAKFVARSVSGSEKQDVHGVKPFAGVEASAAGAFGDMSGCLCAQPSIRKTPTTIASTATWATAKLERYFICCRLPLSVSVEKDDAIAAGGLAAVEDGFPAAMHHDLPAVVAQLDALACGALFAHEGFTVEGRLTRSFSA